MRPRHKIFELRWVREALGVGVGGKSHNVGVLYSCNTIQAGSDFTRRFWSNILWINVWPLITFIFYLTVG